MEGLDETACSTCPQQDGWSITGVLEHLAIMEERINIMLHRRLFQEGVPPDHQPTEEENRSLAEGIASRANRVTAPEIVCPQGRFKTASEALSALKKARESTIAFAANPPGDLASVAVPHPLFGPLTGHQWLLAVAAHTDRHVRQIEEIKAALA